MEGVIVSFANDTIAPEVNSEESVRFLDSAEAVLLRRCLYYFINQVVLAASLVTNTLNIVTFIKAGLSESMSCLFLGLSISDFLHCALVFIERTLGVVEIYSNQQSIVNLLTLGFFFVRQSQIWHVASTLLTVSAAIQKCACVTFPLTFRFFFTRRRVVIVVLVIFASVFISYIPIFVVDTVRPYFSTRFNRTRLIITRRYPKLYRESADYYLFANYVCLPFIAVSLDIVCVIIMTWKLREAARTRQDMTAGQSQVRDISRKVPAASRNSKSKKICAGEGRQNLETNEPSVHNLSNNSGHNKNCSTVGDTVKAHSDEPNDNTECAETNKSNKNVLNERELRVLGSVNLVCGIFICGTAPYCVLTACALFLDAFDHRGRDFTLYFILKSAQEVVYFGSTGVNIFVYYAYNTKFKKAFNRIFASLLPRAFSSI
ncbi:chemosensory receptor c [Plakobranchus ocellatus]|uniref:Chemosensory receptor c n=1 Tax=Plakobranchus ocellatus TaxID=259542 RepID=A0AAV3ZQM5_9GAST|nr:chemosensory receptor c [Plakobranchus ocellatus]